VKRAQNLTTSLAQSEQLHKALQGNNFFLLNITSAAY